MPNESRLHADAPAELNPAPSELGPGYEVRDTNVRAILSFAVAMAILLALTQAGIWGLLRALSGDKAEPPPQLATPDPIAEQRRQLNAEEDAILNGPAESLPTRTPRSAAAAISIEEAIDRIARLGLPRGPDRARTEIQVNSHAGTPAPTAGVDAKKDEPAPERTK